MLVIRRRAGESVLIGDGIEVQIAEIGPTRVKLAIHAPKDVPIMRGEVKLTREANVNSARGVDVTSARKLAAKIRNAGTFFQEPRAAADMRVDGSQRSRPRQDAG